MTTTDTTRTGQTVRSIAYYRTPLPFGTLLRAHLRIWRAQRGVLIGGLVAMGAGVIGLIAATASLTGRVTAADVATHFGGFPVLAFSLIWLAVGGIAGASPFKSGWAPVVLTVAPRRGRWLTACLTSFLLLTLAVAVAFDLLAALVTAVVLATKGQGLGPVSGLVKPALAIVLLVLIQAGVGFLLGAASRSVTAAIIIGYVVAPIIPAAKIGSVDLGRWLDLEGALTAVSSGHPSGGALAAAMTAILLWIGGPAVIAWSRLRKSIA